MIKMYPFIAILVIKATVALVAFDCNSKSVNMTSISLVTTPNCDNLEANITSEEVRIAVTQSTERYEVPFIRCQITTINHLSRCGKTIDTFSRNGLYSEVIQVSKEECTTMANNNKYRLLSNGEFIDLTLNSGVNRLAFTSRGTVSSDGACTPGNPLMRDGVYHDRPLVNTDMTLTSSRGKAIVSVEEKLIKFPNGNTCKVTDMQCYDADYGNIYWDLPTPSCEGPGSEKSLVYEGPAELITDNNGGSPIKYVQVHFGGYDFQILLISRTEIVCGHHSFPTEHPSLFVTLLSAGSPSFPLRRRISAVDVSLLNFVNSKLVYSFRHIKGEVKRLFDLFSQDRCKAHNRITENMMTLAVLSPGDFAYMYGGPGYTAVPRGEVIYLARCRPVPVIPDLDTPGCFNELPVTYNNKSMFASPRSRILLEVGTPIDCLPDLLPKYFINERWYVKSSHGLLDVIPPQTISPDPMTYEFKELSGLAGGGLYSTETIKKYQDALVSPMVEEVVSSRVISSLTGSSKLPSGYQYSMGFSPLDYEVIREKVGGFWERFSNSAVRSGGWFGFILIIFGVFKMITYMITSVFNFVHVREDVGVLWAIPICLLDVVCNLIFHGRLWKDKTTRSKSSKPTDDTEMRVMLPEV